MSTTTQVADPKVELADHGRGPWHARKLGAKTPGEWLAAYGAVFVLVVMVIVFSILIPDTYPTWRNAKAILTSESTVLMVSLGLLVPAVVGEFDLSVGAMVAFASIEMALLSASMVWPIALALTLLSAVAIGLVSGFLVVRIGVNSFIATLGMATLLGGGSLWISGGAAVTENIPESVTNLGQNEVLGIPLPVIYVAILAVILWYGFNHMPIGRKLYATGGNRTAAELSGVRTKRLVIGAFVASAAVAALAGVVTMMQAGAGSPSVGPELLLPAFAAVFLGSTTIIPGRFNVVGTVVGILLLAVGVSGLQQLGAEYYVVPLFNGGVLLVAVALSRILAKERNA
ncbi:MAG: ribose transport system permease protein [Solirubrobacterales bacterium]|jgi:ribose transport system permease protein|nr:ribose transport system permease protein [Solirubrobacterales bacterium]